MGRIDNDSWIAVHIYNANRRGQIFNDELSNWIRNHLSMVTHRCFNGLKFNIYNPQRFIHSYTLFGVDIGFSGREFPRLFNEKCIFCIELKQDNLDSETNFTDSENKIIEFYDYLKKVKNNSTVPITKTLFAWWPDLFIPLDRTHNYNSIIFELQTYNINLPINRGNEIQTIDGIKYIKILRGIQFQLHRWMEKYNKRQTDLRAIDTAINDSPFLRVIDKNYW